MAHTSEISGLFRKAAPLEDSNDAIQVMDLRIGLTIDGLVYGLVN